MSEAHSSENDGRRGPMVLEWRPHTITQRKTQTHIIHMDGMCGRGSLESCEAEGERENPMDKRNTGS
ncbi:jg13843 [Pararge aegeria aegeria]|uniref:Jg13843 protein n=1 Tax=Pararge aegeria aegeria TaxID=348720 RepID=A0A8S4S4K0_9NEOP|nr:jg13843 [Pararge aegeria aegeria]